MNKNGFNILSVVIIMILTSIISGLAVGVILNNNYKNNSGLKNINVMTDENLKEFLNVYSTILTQYYDDVDKSGMIDSAIEGMLNYLGDNYTNFLNAEESKDLSERLEGKYNGIGIIISEQTVQSVIPNSPADIVGLKKGDIISKVNNLDIKEKTSLEIGELIKNSGNSNIKIEIMRGNHPLIFDLKTTMLDVPAITYEIIEGTKTGYIAISIFSKTVGTQFKNALKELEKSGISELIIDVRGNSGGYLNGAVEIASVFLKKGETIYSLEDKNGKVFTKDETNEERKIPIYILIDNDTASASEILAAALVDSYGAITIGEKTYGKGKVQQTIKLNAGATAKYTSAKWYRPNGASIDGRGMYPDYVIKMEEIKDSEENIIEIIDTQLKKAIELIKGA